MKNPFLRSLPIAFSLLISVSASGQQESGRSEATGKTSSPAAVGKSDEFSGVTVKSMKQAMAVITARHRNAPLPETDAPDFNLRDLATGERVSLVSLHKEKPLVLLFTSYQCNVFESGWPSFLRVYEKYKEQANFVMIYIREAHASDGWQVGNPEYIDPKTDKQRMQMAALCKGELNIPFRILVDDIEDPTATRWGAWPIRMFVVKQDGSIGYTSINGPFGFRPDSSFLHGDGQPATNNADHGYNQEPLASYLETLLGAGVQ